VPVTGAGIRGRRPSAPQPYDHPESPGIEGPKRGRRAGADG
jgi:hypothetical protein